MNKFVSKRGEIWKDIPKFEGVYQISNLGRARSLKKNRIYLLKNNIDTNGYYYIIPYVNKKRILIIKYID